MHFQLLGKCLFQYKKYFKPQFWIKQFSIKSQIQEINASQFINYIYSKYQYNDHNRYKSQIYIRKFQQHLNFSYILMKIFNKLLNQYKCIISELTENNKLEELIVMIFDDIIPYDESNHNEIYYDNSNHDILLQQLKNLATTQEAKIYSTFNQDWKAQLDPQVRQWMTQVRQHYFETQKKQQKVIQTIQLESFSSDNQTADLQLDDYFQL